MKQVLAFGDSLTWGSDPITNARHTFADRWPNALVEGLQDTHVISEGLRGRTTAYDRTSAPVDMNGARALPVLLHSHAPLDAVVIMLGTNDVYGGIETPLIRDGLRRLVEIVRHHPWRLEGVKTPPILLIAPPLMTKCDDVDVTDQKVAQSETLGTMIGALAKDLDVYFYDAAQIGRASPADGYHLEASVSRALGLALQPIVTRMLA